MALQSNAQVLPDEDEAGSIDNVLLKSASYLMDAAHDFRNRQKTFIMAKTKVK